MTPSDIQGALETLRAYIHRPGAQAVSVTDPQHEAKVALDLLRTAIAEGESKEDGIGWGYFEGRTAEEWAGTAAAAESERDAAIAEKDEWKRGAEAAYAAHGATMAQLVESEKERERLREALKRLRQEANKDWFNAPDSLCGVIQAITDQALSPDSQEKRAE